MHVVERLGLSLSFTVLETFLLTPAFDVTGLSIFTQFPLLKSLFWDDSSPPAPLAADQVFSR